METKRVMEEAEEREDQIPTVSVLVPVYNVEQYLPRCLDSILGQTFLDFELILCDDGSTDPSGKICEEYAQKDSRISVIHKQNEGLLWTRRVLLRHAKGEYVLCVDSDDWIAPDLLEKTVACAQETNSDVVLFGYTAVTDAGKQVRTVANLYPDGTVFDGTDRMKLFRRFAVTRDFNHIWDKLIRRCLVREEEEQDPLYHQHITGEDKLQLIPIFQRAQRFCYLAQPLYYYRSSMTGMGRNYQLHYMEDIRQVNQRVWTFMERNGITQDTEMVAQFYKHYAQSIVSYIIGTSHNQQFQPHQLAEIYRTTAQSDLGQRTKQSISKVNGKRLHRVVYWMFRRALYRPMVWILRAEQKMMRGIRYIRWLGVRREP